MKLKLLVIVLVLFPSVSAWFKPTDATMAAIYKSAYDKETDATRKKAYFWYYLYYTYKSGSSASLRTLSPYWLHLGHGYSTLYYVYKESAPTTANAIYNRVRAEGYFLQAAGAYAHYQSTRYSTQTGYSKGSTRFSAEGAKYVTYATGNKSISYSVAGLETVPAASVETADTLADELDVGDEAALLKEAKKLIAEPTVEDMQANAALGEEMEKMASQSQELSSGFNLDCNSWKSAYTAKITESIAQSNVWRKMSLHGIADYYYWKYQWCLKENQLHWGMAQRSLWWGQSWVSMYNFLNKYYGTNCNVLASYNAAEANRAWGNYHFWTYAFKHDSTTWANGDKYAATWKEVGDSFQTAWEASCSSAPASVVPFRNARLLKDFPAQLQAELAELKQRKSLPDALTGFRENMANHYRRLMAAYGASGDLNVDPADLDDELDAESNANALVTASTSQDLIAWSSLCRAALSGEMETLCVAIVTFVGKLGNTFGLTSSKIISAVKNKNICNLFTSDSGATNICDGVRGVVKLVTGYTESIAFGMVEIVIGLWSILKTLVGKLAYAAASVAALALFMATFGQAMADSYNSLNTMKHQIYSEYCGSWVQDIYKELVATDCCSQSVIASIELVADIGWMGYGYPPSVTGAIDAGECAAYAQSMCATGNNQAC